MNEKNPWQRRSGYQEVMEGDDPILDASPVPHDWFIGEDRNLMAKPATPMPDSRGSSNREMSPTRPRASEGDAVLINFMSGLQHPELAPRYGEEPLPLSHDSDLELDVSDLDLDESDLELDESILAGVGRWTGKVPASGPCQSCNGVETIVEFCGPDGARTLCIDCDSANIKQEIISNAISSHPQESSDREKPTSSFSNFHKCPYCAMGISEHSTLKEHLSLHETGKPFVCGTCDSSFDRAQDLKRHNKLHSDETTYNYLMPTRRAPVIDDADLRDLTARQSSSVPPISQSSKPMAPIYRSVRTYKEGHRDLYQRRDIELGIVDSTNISSDGTGHASGQAGHSPTTIKSIPTCEHHQDVNAESVVVEAGKRPQDQDSTLQECSESRGEPADLVALTHLAGVDMDRIGNDLEPCRVEEVRDGESETSTTDNDSTMSSVEPGNSSTTSAPIIGNISNIAADELTSIFFQHPEMRVLFEKVVQSDEISTKKFERKTRRLLNDYSLNLRSEARRVDEIQVAALVRRRSRYMAHKVRERIEHQTGPSYLQIKDHDKLIDRQMKIERYLQGLKANLNEKTGEPRNTNESEAENDSDESEDDWAHDLDSNVPALSAIRSFLVESDAFIEFRAKLWDIVDPSMKARLNSISTELEAANNEAANNESKLIQVCLGAAGCVLSCCKTERSNVWKKAVEDYTGTGWDWWPLEQLRPKLPAGYNRLHWQCSCGEDRYEDVPMFFAEQIVRKRRSQPLDLPASNPQMPTQTAIASSPTNRGSRTGQQGTPSVYKSLPDGSKPQQFLAPEPTNGGQRAQVTTKYSTEIDLHVLLNIPVGDDLSMKRIDILDYRDDMFFQKLRAAYISTKGLLRRVFSLWIYSHCDFFEFEKYDEEEIAPCGPGIPPPDNKDYLYDPKPAKNMPPITKHEFKKRFYACHRGCIPLIYGFRNPLFRCRKPCRYSPDAVNRLPKRLWPLEMGGTAREIFWGLYVVENISFFRVAVFHAIVIAPALVFWFLWLFYWGHPGDLQNASVPFLCALGIISLFWYPLYCGKAVVGAK